MARDGHPCTASYYTSRESFVMLGGEDESRGHTELECLFHRMPTETRQTSRNKEAGGGFSDSLLTHTPVLRASREEAQSPPSQQTITHKHNQVTSYHGNNRLLPVSEELKECRRLIPRSDVQSKMRKEDSPLKTA
ncbi:unnamed protein product [Leuciscus chuanchicus]